MFVWLSLLAACGCEGAVPGVGQDGDVYTNVFAAISGDLPQKDCEKTVDDLKVIYFHEFLILDAAVRIRLNIFISIFIRQCIVSGAFFCVTVICTTVQ